MKCRVSKGVLIPGCMGVAAHASVRMSDREIIRQFCTCGQEPMTDQQIEKRFRTLEKKVRELEKLLCQEN